jgi:hypothetical protein
MQAKQICNNQPTDNYLKCLRLNYQTSLPKAKQKEIAKHLCYYRALYLYDHNKSVKIPSLDGEITFISSINYRYKSAYLEKLQQQCLAEHNLSSLSHNN